MEKTITITYKECKIMAIGVWEDKNDEGSFYFLNPYNHSKRQSLEQCFQDWSEQDQEMQKDWGILREKIDELDNLDQHIWDEVDIDFTPEGNAECIILKYSEKELQMNTHEAKLMYYGLDKFLDNENWLDNFFGDSSVGRTSIETVADLFYEWREPEAEMQDDFEERTEDFSIENLKNYIELVYDKVDAYVEKYKKENRLKESDLKS